MPAEAGLVYMNMMLVRFLRAKPLIHTVGPSRDQSGVIIVTVFDCISQSDIFP